MFQSDRLYYDKVDAHCVINDISSSPSPPAGSCKLKSGPPRKSARTTTEPDPVVLKQDCDLDFSPVPSLSQ